MKNSFTTLIKTSSRGASLVEVAIALPFVLFGIFFFIFIGLLIQAKTSLDAAVTRGLRLAITRGVSELTGAPVIADIDAWVNRNGIAGDDSAAPRVLSLISRQISGPQSLSYLNDRTAGIFQGYNFRDLPPEYVYAIVYVNQAMIQSIGQSLKYACDPSSAPSNWGGCLACSFLNPTTLESSFSTSDPHIYSDSGGPLPAPRRRMGLECRYWPSSMLLDPIVKMISLFAGGATRPIIMLSKRQFMDVPEL